MKGSDHRIRPDVLLCQLGITRPEQIDLEAIAYHFGARVKYQPLDGCAARIIGTAKRAIITVDEDSSEQRQRFSLGHELGHWLWDRGTIAQLCDSSELRASRQLGDAREARANRFAAELLMPKNLFRPAAQGMPMTFESVRHLAGMFRTSLTATAIRLVELGSYPAMVVFTTRQGRAWYWGSPEVPKYFVPRKFPGDGAVAHQMLKDDPFSLGPMDVDADEWFDRPGAEDHVLLEDSLSWPNGTVLSLIWWKDESMLQD
ncbi:ImmA/IrrE family metallo-endopeptidase [Thiolapillus sp.]